YVSSIGQRRSIRMKMVEDHLEGNFTPSMSAEDTFEIFAIDVIDFDNGRFTLERAILPVAELDILIQGEESPIADFYYTLSQEAIDHVNNNATRTGNPREIEELRIYTTDNKTLKAYYDGNGVNVSPNFDYTRSYIKMVGVSELYYIEYFEPDISSE